MSNVLIVAEHLNGELTKSSAQAVGFAKDVVAITGGQIIGLVLGSGTPGVADAMGKTGGDRVAYSDNPASDNYRAEHCAPAVAAVAKEGGATVVATPATTTGRDY